MNIQNIISDFIKLGEAINSLLGLEIKPEEFIISEAKNKWFTQDSIRFTFDALSKQLTSENLNKWLHNYQISNNKQPKTIGLILAGNIPLVGLHDILCVLVTGNNIIAKLSHKDEDLYKLIKSLLVNISSDYEDRITFTSDQLRNIDAIIATGSNNSSRYFEYYFGKYPNIIRKNRNSIGIIGQDFTEQDAEMLGEDIFKYFGLGCRNVSLLLIPKDFDLNILINGLKPYENIINHNKYSNNYTYQKTLLAMNIIPFHDNGFCLFSPNNSLTSPISVVHLAYYNNESEINQFVNANKNEIQCIVSKTKYDFNTYRFGMAQKPELWDYADNIDTIEFLANL